MKIWIENSSKPVSELTGKSLFCKRLANELTKRGVEVTDKDEPVDISLNVIRIKHRRAKVKVLRLDGVWHDTGKDYVRKNEGIIASQKKADGVVYQSNFARAMGHKYLGEPRCPSTVIPNGSDPALWAKVKPADFNGKKAFIAFSKWRPHKRLRDIIYSFLQADVKDSMLLIAGDARRSGLKLNEAQTLFSRPNIEYLASLPQALLMPILKGCTASIHLCWFDACPNSVVEAICAGVPVVTNNVGGTWEIVAPSGGYVCAIDEPYDLEPVDLYHPPAIDRSIVAQAIRKAAVERPKINCDRVDIRNVADQYLRFMEALL
jgi:glycosyltransferase involved in cell wall biosynthesis